MTEQRVESPTSDDLVRLSLSLSKVLCLIALIFPLVAALGWIFDFTLLTKGYPTLPAMQPNTAAGLGLAAVAVLLSRDDGPRARGRMPIAAVLASVVLCLGVLTLSEYAFGRDLGIDRILLREGASLDQPFPGRPSPQTSLNFVLLGAAILSFNFGISKSYVGQGGGLAVAANAIVAATGYIFSTHVFYGFPAYAPSIGMAVETAVTFIMLVVALLGGRPHDGVMSLVASGTNSGRMAGRTLVAWIVVPPLVGVATRLGVVAGWYDVSVQVSLFALTAMGLILATTWRATRQLQREELLGYRMFEAIERANRELARAMEERQIFIALVENSPDFIGIADADGKPMYVNPAGRRMVGLSADYPVDGTTIPEYYPPEHRAFASDVIVRAMIEHGRWHGDTYFRHWQTQEAIPVSDEHFMIRDPVTGRTLGMGTVTRDISEARRIAAEREQLLAREQVARQQAESATERLRESEERFRLTIDEAPIGMALVALDGRFVRVNRALCDVVGYTSSELTGLTFQALTHPDDLEADLALAGQLARAEIPRYQLVKRYIRKDGTIVDVQLSASLLRTREGAPRYYIVQVEDITERTRAEAALKDSEGRLTLALDSAHMGMWDLDLLTDTSVRSLRHDQIFGYAAAVPTWGAAIFMTHVVPEDREVARQSFEQAFVSDNFDMECRIRWADESIHWISAKGRVYRNPQGDPVRMMGTVQDVTEQRLAQQALERSEREFRELAEAMPQIVWATRADGWNIYFNQQWVDYTGLTLEESRGEGWITPFHPDDRQRAWDAWKRATQHRETYSLECRLRRADGAYQWWLIRGVPILSANGEIRKWFGTCTDIEQLKVAEQRLQESEAKFSGIVSISADAIISIDEAQRITIFNDGAEQVFGYSKAEAVGTPLANLMPERFRDTHRQHVERFVSGGVTARRMGDRLTPIVGRRKNGDEFPAEAAISKLQVGDKTLLTVAMRDITERKHFEKEEQFLAEAGAALAASLEYDQTLATVAQLVVRDYADWCIVDLMEEHEHLRRVKVASANPANAALGASLEQWPIDRNRPYLIRAVVETRQPLLIEHVSAEHLESVAQGPEHLQALRALGPRSLMAVPLLMRGQLLGTIAFVSSTPSRVYGPEDLRMALALADRAVVAIENARLYRAAVDATELRDQVLGIVAHDLRNPLSTILLNAAALTRRGPDPERRSQKRSDAIHRAATRMNRLIQDLLDVAVMESGQLTVERAPLAVRDLIVGAVDTQRPLASSSSLELRVELDGDLPDIYGDKDRLLQVFENLIGNAIKFTTAGGSITVGAVSQDHQVIFRVTDTGSGIAPENLPHVFDRFWQASKAGGLGAGLGLPITKGIVEAHGGRIWVESTPSRGTTFLFTIPQATPDQGRPSGPSGSSLVERDRAA